MITNLSLLNPTVLTSTRMPSTMDEDGYLPLAHDARHPRYGTPWIAIIASCIIYALLARRTMVQLLTVYVWLRIGVTILTVLASWRLRKTQPDLPRPFRIPWGRAGLLYVIVAPLTMSAVSLVASDPFARTWGSGRVLIAAVMYVVLRKLQAGKAVSVLPAA